MCLWVCELTGGQEYRRTFGLGSVSFAHETLEREVGSEEFRSSRGSCPLQMIRKFSVWEELAFDISETYAPVFEGESHIFSYLLILLILRFVFGAPW